MNLFTHARLVWAQHRAFHAALTELDRYSDSQLRDMGINRGDIVGIAYDEAERRVTTPSTRSASAWQAVAAQPAH